MNRKTIKTRTGAYHVTLPIRLVEEFDELIGFKGSRSAKIATLMESYVRRDDGYIMDWTNKEILELLVYRFSKDSAEDTLVQALMRLISQTPDEQSS
jgi:metal-responsive CopG/Arc/MetJ family transcriptional regulator